MEADTPFPLWIRDEPESGNLPVDQKFMTGENSASYPGSSASRLSCVFMFLHMFHVFLVLSCFWDVFDVFRAFQWLSCAFMLFMWLSCVSYDVSCFSCVFIILRSIMFIFAIFHLDWPAKKTPTSPARPV